ncbi:TPA: hypothetical protein KDY48_004309 [Vibrio parahaemolyticus]|nr:hypothetical protein [Vibrio parahaemolyticus]HBC3383585.1 hypothetical protein [Vibrio parahaemolyticus]HBC3445575.1 hypothetical protein [Vibrio parahaemolyticus]HBC3845393.1 hypothetical protein [Vibrio parahaemolyticus]HBH7861972.1 hypothetical protein [Vibrio parahaemolyticus]
MKTQEQIIFEILDIYPKLVEAKGFIFFGTLEEKPPYEMGTYSSWRLTLDVNPEYKVAMKTIGLLLDSLLENVRVLSPRPHGYIKIENSVVSFQWVTKDIVDTMLDNIEKVSKLDHYRILS